MQVRQAQPVRATADRHYRRADFKDGMATQTLMRACMVGAVAATIQHKDARPRLGSTGGLRRLVKCNAANTEAQQPKDEEEDRNLLSPFRKLLQGKLKAPSFEELKKYGIGMAFSYALVGGLNFCLMIAISWPLFILRNGASPVLFDPLSMNPQFILYLTAVYFSYGTVSTPFLIAGAVALASPAEWALTALQERLKCPRPLAFVLLAVVEVIFLAVFLPAAILAACAVSGTSVWG